MAAESYDVVVLGGGAGGVPAAIRAAQLGGRVAIIEGEALGGLCMNKACIPFGHMNVASNMLGNLSLGKEFGLEFTGMTKDYPTLIKRQNDLIDFMRMGVRSMLNKNKVEIIEGRGRISGKNKVEVKGEIVRHKKLILATGSKWVRSDVAGVDAEEVRNSDMLLNIEILPERVLLFGKSRWNIQIAQSLHRFGSQVTLVTEDKRILSEESRMITSRLTKALKEEGIHIKTQREIVGVKKENKGLHVELMSSDGVETVIVDRIINLDRSASLRDNGLNSISLDENHPYLKVNEKMETEAENVYAIGDLTGPQSRHYSNLASEMGITAAENAMEKSTEVDMRTFTRVLFTQPQVACVGLTPKEAKKKAYEVVTGAAPLSMNPLGMIIAENDGIMEVVAEKKHGEVLGVNILGNAASEMIGQGILAIQLEATLEDLARASFPHPTLSESLAEAGREALGRPIFLP